MVGAGALWLLLLLTLGGGSRLLRSIFEGLESLVNLEDEGEELLSGIWILRLSWLSMVHEERKRRK